MSFINFRKTFRPTEEEKKRYEEQFEKLHQEAIEARSCVVCRHYSFDESVPGFVTYEGDCELGFTPHFGNKNECEYWQE